MKLLKKFIIKLSNDVKLIYVKKKNLLLVEGLLKKVIIEVNFKLIFLNEINSIYVTNIGNNFFSTNRKKKKKSLRVSEMIKIRQAILESSNLTNVKLKLVGIGYKVFEINHIKNLYQFKLGFSHSIFYKIPENVKVTVKKNTLIYLSSSNLKSVTQTASDIRSYKKPEPYKGKGILYYNETVKLKQGKKI